MMPPTFPARYESALVGPLFGPWAQRLVDDLDLVPGERVLDVACGTGIVARLALERVGERGTVAGVDMNPEMIAVAREVQPAIDWREGDATRLPLRDGERFDVVACQQGIQFFPDRSAAMREMRRALVSGGRVAVSAWLPLPQAPLLRELHAVAERRLGPIADRRHAFGDAVALEALLVESGFKGVAVHTCALTTRFADPKGLLQLNAMALVGMSAAKDLPPEERARLASAIADDGAAVLPAYADGTGIAYETAANVATARAP